MTSAEFIRIWNDFDSWSSYNVMKKYFVETTFAIAMFPKHLFLVLKCLSNCNFRSKLFILTITACAVKFVLYRNIKSATMEVTNNYCLLF